jgi:hypothetical protein
MYRICILVYWYTGIGYVICHMSYGIWDMGFACTCKRAYVICHNSTKERIDHYCHYCHYFHYCHYSGSVMLCYGIWQ